MIPENAPASIRVERSPAASRLRFAIPMVVFAGITVALAWGLTRDPSVLPSTLIGKPVPEFSLPPVEGRTKGLSSDKLKNEVSLVNVFASWCTACRAEHPLFMQLQAAGTVPIHGLNYKDKPDDAAAWLDELGDPYTLTGADINGRVGIEWGVYGVPETFVITRDGTVAYKHIGPISRRVLDETLLPLIEQLQDTKQKMPTAGSSTNGGGS